MNYMDLIKPLRRHRVPIDYRLNKCLFMILENN